MKVTAFFNPKHLVITSGNKEVFQSYESVVSINDEYGKVHLSKHFDFSRTTMKYLKEFLGHDIKTTREKIASGEYKIDIDTNGEYL